MHDDITMLAARVFAPLIAAAMKSSATGARLLLLAGAGAPLAVHAQVDDPLPGLPYANAVEAAAADANQLMFNELDSRCNPAGAFAGIPEPAYPEPSSPGGAPGFSCSQDEFFVYLNARELVHTANELRGRGPTAASLGVDQEGLGLALRWTAAEELAAQGSMVTEFANSQLSSMAARMSALRFGAGGFGVAGLYRIGLDETPLLAQIDEPEGAQAEAYSPWGGFLNGSFGYGSKQPTPLEDAFDFDGSEVTFGIDYRLQNGIVVGGIVGLSEQHIDFDEAASAISVVDGDMTSEGTSVILFAMSQGERLNVSGSIGTQSLEYEIERNIKYPSFNPDTASVNSQAFSAPEADVGTASFGLGYAFTWNRFTVEPFVDVNYLDVTIDAFDEQRSVNRLNLDQSRRFDLSISKQRFQSLDASAGLRFQYVLTPRFGVVVPYWHLAAHAELEDDARVIAAGYRALEDVLGRRTFLVPTDAPDEAYFSAVVGFSTVFRGGRQRQAGGPVRGGMMGFFQLETIENLEHYDDQVITGGLRYEF